MSNPRGRPPKVCAHGPDPERYKNGVCKACSKAAAVRWRLANKEQFRAAQWKWRGLPPPTRPEPRHCELCGKEPTGRYARLALDHDHETGAFRGWLCHNCNMAIGKLGDTREGVLRALKYLSGSLSV